MVATGSIDFTGCCVVDVGAGTGIAGLACAALGARKVVLTDLRGPVLDLMSVNADKNRSLLNSCELEVAPLDWFNLDDARNLVKQVGHIDYLIFAEVTYVEHLIEPLIETLRVLQGAEYPVVLMSHGTHRITPLLKFFSGISSEYRVEIVPNASIPKEYRSGTQKVFLKKLKHVSRDVESSSQRSTSVADLTALQNWMEIKGSLLEQFGAIQWQVYELSAQLNGAFYHPASGNTQKVLEALKVLPERSAAILEQLGHAEWQCCESIARLGLYDSSLQNESKRISESKTESQPTSHTASAALDDMLRKRLGPL
uniref:Methyltransferase domain-containing protein n=1 Tax=Timspurckia oligopyrenoides TaxID=708627 RepID=A0A7S1EPZ0_9RHOD